MGGTRGGRGVASRRRSRCAGSPAAGAGRHEWVTVRRRMWWKAKLGALPVLIGANGLLGSAVGPGRRRRGFCGLFKHTHRSDLQHGLCQDPNAWRAPSIRPPLKQPLPRSVPILKDRQSPLARHLLALLSSAPPCAMPAEVHRHGAPAERGRRLPLPRHACERRGAQGVAGSDRGGGEGSAGARPAALSRPAHATVGRPEVSPFNSLRRKGTGRTS